MNINTLFQSRTFRGVLIGIGIAIVLLAFFQAGVFVGFRQAEFSFRGSEKYLENFTGPPHGDLRDLGPKGMISPYGVFGSIIKTDSSSLAVKGQDNVEKIVLVNQDTEIRRYDKTIPLSDLKAGENVVIIGAPDDQGQIGAKLIRVMPGELPPLPAGPGTGNQVKPAFQQGAPQSIQNTQQPLSQTQQ